MNKNIPRRTLRILSLPFFGGAAFAMYCIGCNFMLGRHFRNLGWLFLVLIPCVQQLYKQYIFQNSVLYKMILMENGREVKCSTIYGEQFTVIINNIIKGETMKNGNDAYYTFLVTGTQPKTFFIDYPERMRYPNVLREILSGRNIVTERFDPDVVHDDSRIPYEERLEEKEINNIIKEHNVSQNTTDHQSSEQETTAGFAMQEKVESR